MKVLKNTIDDLVIQQEKFERSRLVQLIFVLTCFSGLAGVAVILFLPAIFLFLCDISFPGVTLAFDKINHVVAIRYRISFLYFWRRFPLDKLQSVHTGEESQTFYAGGLRTARIPTLYITYVTQCKENRKLLQQKISFSSREDAATVSNLVHSFLDHQKV